MGSCLLDEETESGMPIGNELVIVQEMFIQREYKIQEIKKEYPRYILAVDKSGKEDRFVLALFDILKVNKSKLQELVSKMKDSGTCHILIIYNQDVTPSVRTIIANISADIMIELFHIDDLQYNITKHVLQPTFLKIKGPKAFKTLYSSSSHSVMSITDPIARFYGYKKGDVIEIRRKNGYVSYRIVK
jgi:hypothetical protein